MDENSCEQDATEEIFSTENQKPSVLRLTEALMFRTEQKNSKNGAAASVVLRWSLNQRNR